jgi:hypothetical protein
LSEFFAIHQNVIGKKLSDRLIRHSLYKTGTVRFETKQKAKKIRAAILSTGNFPGFMRY